MTDRPRPACLRAITAVLGRRDITESLTAAEASGANPLGLHEELIGCGLFALSIPEAYQGLNVPLRERLHVHRLVARSSPSLQSILTVHEMVAFAIDRYGTRAAKQSWLPQMASGECRAAFALTEPDGGSSVEQVRTSAHEHAAGFVLDGSKSWTSGGLEAGLFLVFATSDAGARTVLIARDTPGFHITASPELSAFKAAGLADLAFSGCVVGSQNQIGRPGLSQARVVAACLSLGRILVAAGAVAIGMAALNALITHANQRVAGRTTLAQRQLTQKVVADMYARLRAGQALVDGAARAFDERRAHASRDAITAKLVAVEAALQATGHAVRFHGAAGLAAASRVLRYAAEARVLATIEGSEEVLWTTLGSDLLSAGSGLADEFEGS